MNLNRLAVTCLTIGLALPSQAAIKFVVATNAPSILNGIAYDNTNTFVAAGENSTIERATFAGNGLAWVPNSVSSGLSLKAATAYGSGRFVVGGGNANNFSSTDGGITWRTNPPAFNISADVQGLGFNGGSFAAVSVTSKIGYSPDASFTWANATIISPVFLESYRAVTPLGTNGFAACGTRGDIRTSPDGGTNWYVARAFNLGDPDLLGIASDGGVNLVCVGTGGTILRSTDSGASWAAANSRTNVQLNAVAYTGSGFIVAGNAGLILTSPDGVTWTPENSQIVTNLYGVVFGTKGNLQGVAVLVGDGGAVVIGGTVPQAPTSNGDKPNCFEAVGIPALSVTPNTNSANPLVAIDWYSATNTTAANLVASNSATFTPTNRAAGSYTYYAQARDTRTEFVSPLTPVTLVVNPPLFASTAASQTNCAYSPAKLLGGVASGGTPPYTYSWSPTNYLDNASVSNPTATLPAGSNVTYTLTVTDSSAAHCTANANITVAVDAVLTASTAASQTNCAYSPAKLLGGVASGGTAPYTYSWSPTNYLDNASVSNPTATLPAGSNVTYTLTVTDSSAAHCTANANITVAVDAVLTASTAASQTNCAYSPAKLLGGVANGGTAPYTYNWSPTNYLDNASVSNPTATLPAGSNVTYTLTVTDSSAAHCTANANITVAVDALLTASTAASQTNCAYSPAKLLGGVANGGTAPYAYSWSPTNYLDNASVSNPTATLPAGSNVTYTLTVTDSSAAHCTANANITVAVDALLTASTAASQTNCAYSPAKLLGGVANGGTAPYAYSWSPTNYLDNASVSNPTATLPAGSNVTYTLTVTDSSAAHCTANANITVAVDAVLTASTAASQTNCAYSPAKLLGGVANGGTAPYAYSWSPTNYLDNASVSNPTATLPAGSNVTYTLTVTDSSAAHCTANANITVAVDAVLTASTAASQTNCAYSPAKLLGGVANGGTAPYTYSWSPTNYLDNASVSNPTATLPAGSNVTYTLTVTDSSAAHCTANANITVAVDAVLTASTAASQTNCAYSPAKLLGGVANGGTAPYTYSWSPTNYLDNASVSNPTATLPAGSNVTYTLTVTDSSAAHCTANASITVAVDAVLTAGTAASQTNCAYSPAKTLGGVASGGTPPYTYSWSPTNWLNDPTSSNPTATLPAGMRTNYTLTVTDSSAAQCQASATITVAVDAVLTASTAASQTNCAYSPAKPLGGVAGGGTPPYTYSWSPTNWLNDPTSSNPTATLPAGTRTNYTLTVTDSSAAQCQASANITVAVDAVLTASTAASQTNCAYSPAKLLGGTASGGTPPYTYSWSPTNWLNDPAISNPTATLPAGTRTNYTLTVTDSSAAQCQASANITVAVDAVLTASTAASQTNCAYSPAKLLGGTASGGTPPYTYSWSPTNWLSDPTTSNPTATLPAGTRTNYTLTVTDSSAAHCTANANITVAVDPVSVGGTATASAAQICQGTSTTISLSGQTGGIAGWQSSTNGVSWTDIALTVNPLDTGLLTNSTQFRAVVTNGVCSATNSLPALVTVAAVSVGGTATASAPLICLGTSTTISLSGQTGAIARWQSSTNGTDWVNIASTNNPLSTGILTNNTQFRAVVTNGVCSAATSDPATVALEPCTKSLTITLAKTNVILEWYGHLELRSASGLTNPPPANWWSFITNGAAGTTNHWTNPAAGSERFFRLYAPTN